MPLSLPVRYILTAVFVAVYILFGYVFHLNAQAYLLSGIPLTIFFQLVIVKQPIYKLWVRDEEQFSLSGLGWGIAIGFMIFPVYKIIDSVQHLNFNPVSFGYYLATIPGAFAAGFAFSKLNRKTFKDLLICLGIVLVIKGIGFAIIISKGQQPNYITAITSLLTYVPIAFIVEEVVFRGLLDTYIQPSQKSTGIWPALFISVLWALWHLPLIKSDENIIFISFGAIIRTASWGIPLSIFQRRSGNLAVPVFSHAIIDAIRDALM